jgi:hypothetical protein
MLIYWMFSWPIMNMDAVCFTETSVSTTNTTALQLRRTSKYLTFARIMYLQLCMILKIDSYYFSKQRQQTDLYKSGLIIIIIIISGSTVLVRILAASHTEVL